MIENPEAARIEQPKGISAFVRRSINDAFVVDEDALYRLSDIIADVSDTSDYVVTLQNGATFRLDSVDAVRNLQNSVENSLRSLEVRTPTNRGLHVDLKLCSETRWSRSYWRVFSSFGEQNALHISQRLDEWLDGIRPRYSRIATMNYTVTFFGVLLAAFLGLVLFTLLPVEIGEPVERGHLFAQFELSQLLDSWIWLTPFLLAIPADYVRSRLFPRATFAIGDGMRRSRQTALLRKAFASGVGVLLLLGITFAVLAITHVISV